MSSTIYFISLGKRVAWGKYEANIFLVTLVVPLNVVNM